jgi:Ca-activated chloride channel family protein
VSAWWHALTGLGLREPGWLWVAALLPAALAWRWMRPAPRLIFAPTSLLPPGRTLRLRLRGLPRVLQVAGLLLLVLALARPAARVALPAGTEGIDILLCLDVSSSMTNRDMDRDRTRLEVARDAAADFVRGRPHDRIGLLAFARYPDLRCPPTLDHDALLQILGDVATVPADGPEDATGLGAAVARAAQVLSASDAPSRVVILLTDGEENVAVPGAKGEIAPAHAGQLCQRLGVRVYAIVAGEGRRTPAGTWVALDTGPVRRMAERTGGSFHRARDARAVTSVYERIDKLERAPIARRRSVLEDRALGFLIAGLLLVLLARLLGATWLEVLP